MAQELTETVIVSCGNNSTQFFCFRATDLSVNFIQRQILQVSKDYIEVKLLLSCPCIQYHVSANSDKRSADLKQEENSVLHLPEATDDVICLTPKPSVYPEIMSNSCLGSHERTVGCVDMVVEISQKGRGWITVVVVFPYQTLARALGREDLSLLL